MKKYIVIALNSRSIEVGRYEAHAKNVYDVIEMAEDYFKKNDIVYDRIVTK